MSNFLQFLLGLIIAFVTAILLYFGISLPGSGPSEMATPTPVAGYTTPAPAPGIVTTITPPGPNMITPPAAPSYVTPPSSGGILTPTTTP